MEHNDGMGHTGIQGHIHDDDTLNGGDTNDDNDIQ